MDNIVDEFDWDSLLDDVSLPTDDAAAFPGDGSALPLLSTDDAWAGSNGQHHVDSPPRPAACLLLPHQTAADVSPPPLLQQDDGCGAWEDQDLLMLCGDIDISTEANGGLVPPQPQPYTVVVDSGELGHGWMIHGDDDYGLPLPTDEDQLPSWMFDQEAVTVDSSGTNQASAAVPSWCGVDMMDYLLPEPVAPSAANADQAAGVHSALELPPDPVTAAADVPALESQGVMVAVADMVRVAEECGADEGSRTVWSDEEHRELLHRFHLYGYEQDIAMRCFMIAFHLPKKTAMDVALRCRWFQDKGKETAKQAELQQKKDAGAVTVKKGRGAKKVAKKNDKMHTLSKGVRDSKSASELPRDNHIFLQQIEQNIKTGELDDSADYLYYVKLKTNTDAIAKGGSQFCNISVPPMRSGSDRSARPRGSPPAEASCSSQPMASGRRSAGVV